METAHKGIIMECVKSSAHSIFEEGGEYPSDIVIDDNGRCYIRINGGGIKLHIPLREDFNFDFELINVTHFSMWNDFTFIEKPVIADVNDRQGSDEEVRLQKSYITLIYESPSGVKCTLEGNAVEVIQSYKLISDGA